MGWVLDDRVVFDGVGWQQGKLVAVTELKVQLMTVKCARGLQRTDGSADANFRVQSQ